MLALRRRVIKSKYLELSPTTVSFEWNDSGAKIINVTSNTTWDVKS